MLDKYINGEGCIKLLFRFTPLVNTKSRIWIQFFLYKSCNYNFPQLHQYKLKNSSIGQKPVSHTWKHNYPSNNSCKWPLFIQTLIKLWYMVCVHINNTLWFIWDFKHGSNIFSISVTKVWHGINKPSWKYCIILFWLSCNSPTIDNYD